MYPQQMYYQPAQPPQIDMSVVSAIQKQIEELRSDLKKLVHEETRDANIKFERELNNYHEKTDAKLAQMSEAVKNQLASIENKTAEMVVKGLDLTKQAKEIEDQQKEETEDVDPQTRATRIMDNARTTITAIGNMGTAAKSIANSLNTAILGEHKVEVNNQNIQPTENNQNNNQNEGVAGAVNQQVNNIIEQKPSSDGMLNNMGIATKQSNNNAFETAQDNLIPNQLN